MSASLSVIEEANEVSAVVGEQITSALDNLRADAAETMRRLADIQAAWAERDWAWLADAGVLSHRLASELRRLELECC